MDSKVKLGVGVDLNLDAPISANARDFTPTLLRAGAAPARTMAPLPAPRLHWDARSLQEQLEPALPDLNVEVVERTVSTNTALLERARLGGAQDAPDPPFAGVHRSVESAAFGRRSVDRHPCLLVAEHQTGGRGRQGREWRSAPGASLTFSLALSMTAGQWAGLSLAVGVAVADALDPPPGPAIGRESARELSQAEIPPRTMWPAIGLKWPNDLWLLDGAGSGRKLGGILIETMAAGTSRRVVIGIGVNVLPMELSDASTGYASMHELDAATSAPQVLHTLALPLVLALREFEHTGFAAFAERYAARDLLRGRTVRTTHPEAAEGVARGVSAHAALRVETAAGLVHVASGEVSVRLDPGRDPHIGAALGRAGFSPGGSAGIALSAAGAHSTEPGANAVAAPQASAVSAVSAAPPASPC